MLYKEDPRCFVGRFCLLAEDMRFELTEACTSPPFQDGALNRSANPPVPFYYTKKIRFVYCKFDLCTCFDEKMIF